MEKINSTPIIKCIVGQDEAKPRKRNSTKSIRTRARLKSAARQIFERDGHSGVTAQSVSSAADFSYGTFYKYYKNKDQILIELCSDYFEALLSGIATSFQGETPFIRMFASQLYYIEEVIDSWQFHRAFIGYSLENSAVGDLIHDARIKEAKRTAFELRRQWQDRGSAEVAFSEERALLSALALNTMTEGYLQDMMRPSTASSAVAAVDARKLAFELSRIFYRGAFLEEVPVNFADLPENRRPDENYA